MSSSDSPTDEIERLTRLLRERDAEIARMRAEATGAEALITHLRLTIAKMRRELFGPRSEHKARLLAVTTRHLQCGRRRARLLVQKSRRRGIARQRKVSVLGG